MKKLTPELLSALIYIGVSLAVAGIFLGITVVGDYTWAARGGGAAWVFLLSIIILMPLVIPAVRRWRGDRR